MSAYISQILARAVQVKPDGVSTKCGTRVRTWAETARRVARLAQALNDLGVRSGDRVCILALNSDRYFELLFAIWRAGAVVTPLNMRLSPAEIRFRLSDCGADVLFVDVENLSMVEELRAFGSDLPELVLLGDDASRGLVTSEQLIERSEPGPDQERHGDDLAHIIYTGGSTGRAKGVMLSHTNVCVNGLAALQTIGYDESSVFLHAGPMSHLADGMSIFAVTMVGATHVFLPRFTAENCLALIEAHKVTHTCIVPTMVELLVQSAESRLRDVSSLRQIQFGGAPMPEGTLQRAIGLWPDILFLHGYGMTEMSPLITMMPPKWRRPSAAQGKLASCGQAVPNVEVRIVDPDGRECPRGQVGEIIARGPTVMLGYWNLPDQTQRAVRNGWMHTEDAGYMDDDGLVYVVDRLKDMIISGGENIYSSEVENALSTIPGVLHAAVIGVPHPVWGEAVEAYIVLDGGARLTEAEITAGCKLQIASYKCPKSVVFIAEMPTTNAGKVDKRSLRALAADQRKT